MELNITKKNEEIMLEKIREQQEQYNNYNRENDMKMYCHHHLVPNNKVEMENIQQ